ncbi:natural killer cells antigen CD94-like [Echeneis naucrates]|uniref:Natural killer cells antigen CD94-like n=1 Tax=Echeneis naucrates TaxID=173247 RepID=A0A665U6D0_ECHNA|nr:natural killer cells antigen CD94-like [Echeneis naucrates]
MSCTDGSYCVVSKEEDRGEGVVRLVDVYESIEAIRENHAAASTWHKGAHSHRHLPAAKPNPFRTAMLVLGLLCFLLWAGGVVLSIFLMKTIMNNEQLTTSLKELRSNYTKLSNDYCQQHDSTAEWKRFRCSCYYISIDKKSWNESREDCRSRGAHLVIINSKEEQEFVSKINGHGSSWIGLQLQKIHSENWSGKDKWQWKWVDGSLPNYLAWLTAVTLYPENTPNAYIGGRGKWEYDEDGPKQWICETDI